MVKKQTAGSTVHVNFDIATYRKLRKQAKANYRPITQEIRAAIDAWLKKS